jgi:ribosomal protein S18 acetylase RimI-like enzyme
MSESTGGFEAAREFEAIERATVAAVSPDAVEEWSGWLLPYSASTIRRAKSAVPLQHGPADPGAVPTIEARYRARALPPSFRLPDDSCFDPVRDELIRRGYREQHPTLVQITHADAMRRATDEPPAEVTLVPDESWDRIFLGEGFDPIDGAHRLRALRRAPDAVYASVREGSRTLAVGVAAFGFGWVSVHGMRTDLARRGEGLARRVLAGLAESALTRGLDRVALQVEEHNAAARALYRRAGFQTAWSYRYWIEPA